MQLERLTDKARAHAHRTVAYWQYLEVTEVQKAAKIVAIRFFEKKCH